ncbi:hypothetical protein H257_18248 [Aphanomyces astaci]|uniref:Uncharacterized protein n=1 Tax=Aphanomyces astaci TaxID=112090 RepID=W4FBU1_APHAT|nr:hypothetical protein H257_18248 [Aphanomyces astaci]ETV64952.1 hypothetical protein H257_18248 [Aphanomyces astaci]|eukprot:XP_009845576.1 hypothetical protein H257_18248 [Aphanomyces astaci]
MLRQYTQDTKFKDVHVRLMEAFEDLTPRSIKGCIHKADIRLYKLAEYMKGLQEVEASDNESVEGSSDGGSVTSSNDSSGK